MKLEVPATACPITRVIVAQRNEVLCELDGITPLPSPAEITLPEGACEDDVDVYYVGIGSNGKPSGDPVLLKACVARTPAPPVVIDPLVVIDSTPEPTPAPEINSEPTPASEKPAAKAPKQWTK